MNGHRRNASASGGFSLLEVVLVVAIIAVLAAIAAPRYGRAAGRYRADVAARRIVADLEYARLSARTAGAVAIRASCLAVSDMRNWRGPSSSSPPASTGIRSMKQIGHLPSFGSCICGCIEHVHMLGSDEATLS